METKPYWLFAGMNFEAAGGMCDFEGGYESVDDALDAARIARRYCGWFHIVDARSLRIIAYDSGGFSTFATYDADKLADAIEYRTNADGDLQVVA